MTADNATHAPRGPANEPTGWLQVLRGMAALTVPASLIWDEVFSLDGPPLCPSHRWLGFECPACGLTRSFVAMGNLELGAAWQHNPGGPLLWIGAVLLLAHAAAERLGGPLRPTALVQTAGAFGVGTVLWMVIAWIAGLAH